MASANKGAGGQSAAEVPRSLPRGPHGLPRELVAASQRSRLLDAVVEVVAGRGYAAATVADVIGAAGVSRKAFYAHFKDKADCFAAAFDAGAEQLAAAIVDATTGEGAPSPADPEAQLAAGYSALLGALADNPAMAKCFVVVAPEAGPVLSERRESWREASIARICWLYELGARDRSELPAELPASTARAIVGAVEALIVHQLQSEGAESLRELTPTVVGVARALMFAPNLSA